MKKRILKISPLLILKLKGILEKDVLNEFSQRFSKPIQQETLLASLDIYCKDDNECKQKILKTSRFFTFRYSFINEIEGYVDLCNYQACASYNICKYNTESCVIGIKNHCCRFEEEHDKEYYDSFPEIEEEEIDGPIEFIKRNTIMASVKNSFAYLSHFINMGDFELK